jgi:8-amino-7-oxononanoate synthase
MASRHMESLDFYARDKLAALRSQDLLRTPTVTSRHGGTQVRRHGRTLISFSCNDYFGLANDPRVVAAATAALAAYGAGAGASRLVTGDHPVLQDLEAALARVKGKAAALVFGSGYLANAGVPGALVGRQDLIFIDALSHASMFAGAKLSGARTIIFRHNDLDDLQKLLASERGTGVRGLVMTESVFSMDGDRAPVDALVALAERYDAWLMIDDAHGLDGEPRTLAPLELGTLSKGLGSYGGFLAASAPIIELMRNRARSFVYATGLPPASAAAALAALNVLAAEPERQRRPLALARRFTNATGLPLAQSAIVPWIVGEATTALKLSKELEAEGFLVVAIRPPTVPQGSARLRFTFSAAHDEATIDALAAALLRLTSRD